ncbi:hypothetical protein Tco_1253672 [Tanacetum coccineum]
MQKTSMVTERPLHSIWDQTSRYTANYNHMTANRIDVIDMACEEYSQEVLGFSNSNGLSLVLYVPKRGAMFRRVNDENDLLLTRIGHMVGGVCIDYRKLNEATERTTSHLPSMDQMLERLRGESNSIVFLDGFVGYFQIHRLPEGPRKTPLLAPYGSFAISSHAFWVYAMHPARFQRSFDGNLSLTCSRKRWKCL